MVWSRFVSFRFVLFRLVSSDEIVDRFSKSGRPVLPQLNTSRMIAALKLRTFSRIAQSFLRVMNDDEPPVPVLQ